MTAALNRYTVTTDTYHRMIEVGILTKNDRVELIRGEIINKSARSTLHTGTVDRISNLLPGLVKDHAIIRVQGPVTIPDHSEPEPDITLLKPRPDFYATKYAQPADTLLVVEVADTSWPIDYEIKRPLYASVGIPELWLVNLNKYEIEVHRTPGRDTYKNISILQSGDTVRVPVPGVEMMIEVDKLLGEPPER